MQPPIRFTGDPNLDLLIFIVGLFVAVYWFRALRLAREGARRFLRNAIKAFIAFLLCAAIFTATQTQTHLEAGQVRVLSAVIAFALFVRWQGQKRSRYIPKATKRAVIEMKEI